MFLVADTQLYKRLCPSVRPLVGPWTRVEKRGNERFRTFLVATVAFPPLPTRPQLMAVYPALFLSSLLTFQRNCAFSNELAHFRLALSWRAHRRAYLLFMQHVSSFSVSLLIFHDACSFLSRHAHFCAPISHNGVHQCIPCGKTFPTICWTVYFT